MLFKKPNLSRFLSNTNKGKPTFLIYSLTMATMLFGESYLEYWGIIIFDMDRTISRIATQPFTIRYRIMGRFRNYTPDALIELSDGSLYLIEFKYSDEAETEEHKEKHLLLNEIVVRRGYSGLLTLTEKEICVEPLRKNSILLNRYGRGFAPHQNKVVIIRDMLTNKITTLGELANESKSYGIHLDTIMYLSAHNIIQLDMFSKIDVNANVRWNPDYEI